MNPHDKYWKKSTREIENTTIDNAMIAITIMIIFMVLIAFLTF